MDVREKLSWRDTREIALQLLEKFPDVDPLSIQLNEIRNWVILLPNFQDEGNPNTVSNVEAIQKEWLEAKLKQSLETRKQGLLRITSAVSPRVLLPIAGLVTLGLFIAAFYPGVMTVDSYYQYLEAQQLKFDDWHPPIMAALWSLTDRLIPGPGGMFLLHLFLMVASFFLLAKIALIKGHSIYFLPLLGMFLPVVSCISFVIWKDVSLAATLLFMFSLWYFWRVTGKFSISRFFLILFLLFYAASVRHNALPAIPPLLIVILSSLTSVKRALLLSLCVTMLFHFGERVFSYGILNAHKSHLFHFHMADDLLGIYALSGENYIPESYINKSNVDQMMKSFFTIDPFDPLPDTVSSEDPKALEQLKAGWMKAVLQHPGAYLAQRWMFFKSVVTGISPFYPVSWPIELGFRSERHPRPLLVETRLGKFHSAYINFFYQHFSFCFKGFTYIILGFAILFYSLHRKIFTVTALASSSLIYALTYFISGRSVEYRFFYWPVLASVLSLLILWIEKLPASRSLTAKA